MLRFKGCGSFRQRVVLSTLTGRPIRIDDIRADDESPGLRDFEASLLRLMEKITNGCMVEINETGTSLRYKPGAIICGPGVVHDCGTKRGVGWFIEPLVLLALFAKKPLSATLLGITSDHQDLGVDTIRTVTLPLLRKFGVDAGLEMRVVRRGAAPGGGGEVALRVPLVKQLSAVDLTDEGMVKRVRGVAYSMKVSPQTSNRMVDGARGVLNPLLADVYIFTDAVAGQQSGNSPGYGLTLVAETTTGCLISAECSSTQSIALPNGEEPLVVPEDIGQVGARLLLEEVRRGGVVDGSHQPLALTLAALGPDEVSQIRLGPLTPAAVHTLRHLRDFLGVTFNIRAERGSQTIFLTCIGANMQNINRKAT